MGGRDLTRIERLHRAFFTGGIDLPRVTGGKIAEVAYVVVAFFRWVWLRLTRKTAYRFAPMYETKILEETRVPGGVAAIKQANGLYLPAREKGPTDPTLRADMAAAWDAVVKPEEDDRMVNGVRWPDDKAF